MTSTLPVGVAVAPNLAVEARQSPDGAVTMPTGRAGHEAPSAPAAPARSGVAVERCRRPVASRLPGRVGLRRVGDRGRRLLALGIAVALGAALVAGCGTSTPATAVPASFAASSASPSAAGSTGAATPRPAGAYSLTLPKGWRAVQIGSNYATTASAYNTLNLRFASSLMSQLSGLPNTATAYAFDGSDPTVQSGTLVALTVTEVVLPVTVDLDAFSSQVGQQVSLVAETNVPSARIQTASGPADRYDYVATFGTTSAGTEVASITQYVMVKPGRGYVLTFSTTPARAAADAPTFESIADSIALTP